MTRISPNAVIGERVTIKEGVIIEDNVTIADNCYIDYYTVIKENVSIGYGTFIGANCILGEVLSDFFGSKEPSVHPLVIGEGSLIRSSSIVYGGSTLGAFLQTGHRVTIRENTRMGRYVIIGTLSDIQGDCDIDDYVHMHSNVHIGMKTILKKYAWIYPFTVFTNDPTPPSETMSGTIVEEFAVVCTGTLVLPGLNIGKDALVGAGTIVTKNVPDSAIFMGSPGKVVGDISQIRNKNGNPVYPWRNTFSRGMPWSGQTYDEWQNSQVEQNHKRGICI